MIEKGQDPRMKNSNSEVKRKNKIAVFQQLMRQKKATKPELSAALNLSVPTVGQLVEELVAAGLVREDGMAASIGGRRAVSYCPLTRKYLALGVDITKNHIGFALVDLNGEMLTHERRKLTFARDEAYQQKAWAEALDFLARNQVETDRLIGVGISVPGIVSEDRKSLQCSHILGIQWENWRPEAPPEITCPCFCFNDADAACMVECFAADSPDNFTFLSLSNTVGGAMVNGRQIVRGISGRCGELGHVCLVPGGRMCYCGRRGHYDAYGAAWILAEKADGSLEQFFARLEQGDPALSAVFEEYLDYLAMLVQNVIMFTDVPIVLGGYVGSYMGPYLGRLREKVTALDNRGWSSEGHIQLCRYKIEAAAVGSALFFVEQYIRNL